ncbi:MAG: cytochrome b5-like heme/steroid binding domain-containing protein [Candidatus Magasanikbacteria bacterium]|nr:cytochrome b5-like heme/steroid binding domain-containing protein [Candidatus Magasanikbacteria bacterium]
MKIKIAVGVALFIFWAVVVAILVSAMVTHQNNQNKNLLGSSNNSVVAPIVVAPGQEIVLSSAEVAKHNTAQDCWMIISNKVYNFTSFLTVHPGGAYTMTPYCGKDGSQGYQTKDLSRPTNHSSTAYSMLAAYYLGDLNQKITGTQLNQNVQNAQQAPALFGGGDREND